MAGDDFAGNLARLAEIVLADEVAKQGVGCQVEAIAGCMMARSQQPSGTYREHRDAQGAGATGQGKDIGIAVAGVDELTLLKLAQLLDLVSQARGFLEVERLAGGFHVPGQFLSDSLALAFQALHGMFQVSTVIRFVDVATQGALQRPI